MEAERESARVGFQEMHSDWEKEREGDDWINKERKKEGKKEGKKIC